MFGKPQWFCLKTWGWGLHPVTKQGWLWLGGWLLVMLTPYVTFFANRMWTEGIVWLVATGGVMLYEVATIVNALKRGNQPVVAVPKTSPSQPTAAAVPKKGDVLYIGDEPTAEELATKRFDFRLQR